MNGERSADILKAAEAARARITSSELSATHRRDLIPRPITRFLGHGRGTESVYPSGTGAQVIACCRLKERHGTDFPLIGWELWKLGFQVGEQYWREPLDHSYGTLKDIIRWAVDRGGGGQQPILSDEASDAIESVVEMRNNPRSVGIIRRKLRRNNFSTAMRMSLEVVTGTFCSAFPHYENDLEHDDFVLARTLGTRAASHKRKPILTESSFVVSSDDAQKMFKSMTKKFSKCLKGKTLIGAFPEPEIVEARLELVELLNLFLSVELIERQAYSRSSPALGLLAAIAGDAA